MPNRDGPATGWKSWLLAGSMSLVGGAGLAAYAYAVEPRRLQVVRYRLGVAELPAALAGVRIVHLTDFHLGMRPTRWSTLHRAVAATVAEGPDLIALTGDMTHDGVWARGGDLFARLAAAAPTVAVLGNHDHHATPSATEEIVARLERVGVRVLRNTHATVAIRGGTGELVVVAVDDPHLDYDNLGAAMSGLSMTPDPNRPALLLGHVPDIVDQAPADRFILTLAGHTHGGQVRLSPLKRFTPLEVPMIVGDLDSRYPRGTHVVNGNPLFVSNGLGLSGAPLRFLAPPQVARFTLDHGVVGDAGPDDPKRYFAPDGGRHPPRLADTRPGYSLPPLPDTSVVGTAPTGAVGRAPRSRLGHQFHRPSSSTTAGTISDRTTKVSSSTPTATLKPVWKRSWSGRVISAAKVPARMIPADVITPPVRPSARRVPAWRPWCRVSSRIRAIRKML